MVATRRWPGTRHGYWSDYGSPSWRARGAPDRAVRSRGAVIASESGSWLSALWGAEARKSLEEPRQVQEARESGWLCGRR